MRQISLSTLALFAGAVAMMCFGTIGAQLLATEPLPAGWTVFPTPADGGDAVLCANYSRQGWLVTFSEAGVPLITPQPWHRGLPPQPALPFGVALQKGMIGYRSSVRVKNGWLLGFDGGEFGGGLWLADSEGKSKRISKENVHGFIETSGGILIFVGVAHLTLDSGRVLIAPDTITSDSDLKALVELDGAPEAFVKASADAALVITTSGISRITSAGTSERLLHRKFGILYPNSIVLSPDGVIYATMRLFVVRLVPHSGEYTEQWLVPDGCEKFHKDGFFDCACSK